jgi:type II secretory pathway component PulC
VAKQQKKAAAEKTGPVSTQAIDQAAENLRLVGISYAPNPKDSYAMIEDLASKITYFIKVNQAISGVKVADIQKDRVLLTYQGQEKEMR